VAEAIEGSADMNMINIESALLETENLLNFIKEEMEDPSFDEREEEGYQDEEDDCFVDEEDSTQVVGRTFHWFGDAQKKTAELYFDIDGHVFAKWDQPNTDLGQSSSPTRVSAGTWTKHSNAWHVTWLSLDGVSHELEYDARKNLWVQLTPDTNPRPVMKRGNQVHVLEKSDDWSTVERRLSESNQLIDQVCEDIPMTSSVSIKMTSHDEYVNRRDAFKSSSLPSIHHENRVLPEQFSPMNLDRPTSPSTDSSSILSDSTDEYMLDEQVFK
jgi:hypothetical protein